MIAFLFPIVLGALIGFTFDDGNINKSDFGYINKELVEPMVEPFSKAKNNAIKAYDAIASDEVAVLKK